MLLFQSCIIVFAKTYPGVALDNGCIPSEGKKKDIQKVNLLEDY